MRQGEARGVAVVLQLVVVVVMVVVVVCMGGIPHSAHAQARAGVKQDAPPYPLLLQRLGTTVHAQIPQCHMHTDHHPRPRATIHAA